MSTKKSEQFGNDEGRDFGSSFGTTRDRSKTSRTTFAVPEKLEKIQLSKRQQQETQQRQQPQAPTLQYQRGQSVQAGQQQQPGITVGKSGFTDQLALILGGVYAAGASYGVGASLWGLIANRGVKRKRYAISSRVKISRQLTEGFKVVSHYGNTAAAVGLLYMLISKSSTYIFQEELEYLPKPAHHSIFGFMAGALCKSINGARPAMLAGVLGALAAPVAVWSFARMSKLINI